MQRAPYRAVVAGRRRSARVGGRVQCGADRRRATGLVGGQRRARERRADIELTCVFGDQRTHQVRRRCSERVAGLARQRQQPLGERAGFGRAPGLGLDRRRGLQKEAPRRDRVVGHSTQRLERSQRLHRVLEAVAHQQVDAIFERAGHVAGVRRRGEQRARRRGQCRRRAEIQRSRGEREPPHAAASIGTGPCSKVSVTRPSRQASSRARVISSSRPSSCACSSRTP